MERNSSKSGLYEVRIEKVITVTPSEGDMLTCPDTEVQYILVKNFENFLIYLSGVNREPDVVGVRYIKIENSVLIL
jgi:hypothetical protein